MKKNTEKEQHKKFLDAYEKTLLRNSLLSRSRLSIHITGNPYKIRNDFVPVKFRPMVLEMEKSIRRILLKYGFNGYEKK